MKEMTLQDVKDVSLEILQEFHNFCVKNNIRYSIACGTLIGAVRHGGFIPWDDDIDVYVPRPDYERLCKIYESTPKYKLVYRGNSNMLMPFARLCEMEDTYVDQSEYPWIDQPVGLWIDIFPLDGIESDSELMEIRKVRAKQYRINQTKVRRARRSISSMPDIKSKIHLIINKIKYPTDKPIDDYINYIKEIDFTTSEFVASLSCPLGKTIKSIFKREDVEDIGKIKFEEREFCAFKRYHDILSATYGDYMTPPPADKRKSTHHMFHQFWK